MTEAERRTALEAIATEVRACTACRLHVGRTQAVPGEGHPSTEVLFVGEGPGYNEDRQGRPFVGAAGSFLTELLGSVGWQRDEVFITNVVKCRPPDNRDPEPDEIAACAPFLRRQVEALDPALIVTLGRHSMGRFLPGARIGQVHGTTKPADPETGAHGADVFAMYHPAAALHQGSLRRTLLDDMARVPDALVTARERRAARSTPEPGPVAAEAAPETLPPPTANEADVTTDATTAPATSSTLQPAPDPDTFGAQATIF
jgi:DNA polymerase